MVLPWISIAPRRSSRVWILQTKRSGRGDVVIEFALRGRLIYGSRELSSDLADFLKTQWVERRKAQFQDKRRRAVICQKSGFLYFDEGPRHEGIIENGGTNTRALGRSSRCDWLKWGPLGKCVWIWKPERRVCHHPQTLVLLYIICRVERPRV